MNVTIYHTDDTPQQYANVFMVEHPENHAINLLADDGKLISHYKANEYRKYEVYDD